MSKSKRNLENEVSDLREENRMLDTVVNTLMDVLEQKGLMSHAEWELKAKEKLNAR